MAFKNIRNRKNQGMILPKRFQAEEMLDKCVLCNTEPIHRGVLFCCSSLQPGFVFFVGTPLRGVRTAHRSLFDEPSFFCENLPYFGHPWTGTSLTPLASLSEGTPEWLLLPPRGNSPSGGKSEAFARGYPAPERKLQSVDAAYTTTFHYSQFTRRGGLRTARPSLFTHRMWQGQAPALPVLRTVIHSRATASLPRPTGVIR